MAIIKTLARALQPGDVVLDPLPSSPSTDRAVVLAVAIADPGPVGLQLGRLGPLPEHLARVATVAWHPDYVVDVERPDTPPTEPATVDKHLDAVLRASGSALRHYGMAKTLEGMRAAMRAALEEERPRCAP